MQADMFDSGLQVDGRHLRLGSDSVTVGGACGAVPSGEEEFTIRVQLNNCGTKLFVRIVLILKEHYVTFAEISLMV